MEYSINQLAKLAGVSSRTLRYYEQIGLLNPRRTKHNRYRVYGMAEVDRLQQILFYRELGFQLEEIKQILLSKNFHEITALNEHMTALQVKKAQIEKMIDNLQKTIESKRGGFEMSDKEKFEGFKKQLIDENEAKFGKEIREKYGEENVEQSNARMMGLSQAEYEQMEALSIEIKQKLKEAFERGNPSSDLAQEVCDLHRQWLGYTWTSYSKKAHLGLGQMYVEDERFKANYDAISPGAAEFLYEALKVYCKE
jgi:DNA-binding transcriptional MerR regulator